jgi:Family of unknown function (DUF6188)
VTDAPRLPYIRRSDGSVDQGRYSPPRPDVPHRLGGRDLAFIRIDRQARLQFDQFEVVIETPFIVISAKGEERTADPSITTSLVPLLELYPDALMAATVDSDATLQLRLSSGASLVVPPHPEFEAWQVNGRDGFLVVCTPGGANLAVWSGSQDS